jgi:hypothetical protein
MFTTVDKAIVGLVMAVVFLVNNFTDFNFALGEDTVNAIAAVLTPLLVYIVPNRPADA